MSIPQGPKRRLPANPSQENLRKQAKGLAKAEGLRLAAAQRRLANEHGHRTWAELMRAAEPSSRPTQEGASPLSLAAARAAEAEVRVLLAQGEPVDGRNDEPSTPLWHACTSDAPADQRMAIVRLLLEAGASPRQLSEGGATPLHAAARVGPLALVELLIRGGALSWLSDQRGRTALDYARAGSAVDRDAIVELLDRPVIRDANFRAAVRAIHTGDIDDLGRVLDQHPHLLHARAIEPDCYPQDYFRDPKLFWFIANNPTLMRVPANIAAVAQVMIARGVAQADLDTTLELVISNSDEIMGGHQAEVLALLLSAGANASTQAIVVALAHWQIAPIRALLDRGLTMTAPIAAALGENDKLASLLSSASADERQMALGLAVINRQLEAARLCLDAGADPNRHLPVHKHSQALHQAALHNDVALLELLVARGARIDTRDTLWNGTPLGWAVHNRKTAAEAYLRSLV